MHTNRNHTDAAEPDETPEMLIAAVRAFLRDAELTHEFISANNTLVVPIECDGVELRCSIICENEAVLQFLAKITVSAPSARWHAVLDCLNYLNRCTRFGHFVLQTSDGSVAYRHGVVLPGGVPASEWIAAHFGGCLHTALSAAPHLMRLFFGNADPISTAEAIQAGDSPDKPNALPEIPEGVRPELN